MGRPRLSTCVHEIAVSTVTAGLERRVCEGCGHVSVRYIADTVRIFPDYEELATRAGVGQPAESAPSRLPTCGRCDATAKFMIPRGLACAEHAWAAASRQDALGQELWIPIRIDQSAKASG